VATRLSKSTSENLRFFADLGENLMSAQRTFKSFHTIAESALMRLIVAGSVVELEEEEEA
jgi:hypothetical protein